MTNYGQEFKRSLLEVSELELEDSFLYTSYYNTAQRPNRSILAQVSEWIPSMTKADKTLVNKRKKQNELVQILPRLSHRTAAASVVGAISHRYNAPNDLPEEEQKRYSSMQALPHPKANLTQKTQKLETPHPKLSTILLGLSLPKVRTKCVPDKYSKYDALSTSVCNNVAKLKQAKARQHLSEQKPQKLGNSHTRLLNDQLIHHLLTPAKPHKKFTSKISVIKYNYRRRAKLIQPLSEEPSFQIRNANGVAAGRQA